MDLGRCVCVCRDRYSRSLTVWRPHWAAGGYQRSSAPYQTAPGVYCSSSPSFSPSCLSQVHLDPVYPETYSAASLVREAPRQIYQMKEKRGIKWRAEDRDNWAAGTFYWIRRLGCLISERSLLWSLEQILALIWHLAPNLNSKSTFLEYSF